MQHLEQQVVQLEGQLREVQLQLGLSGSDRYDAVYSTIMTASCAPGSCMKCSCNWICLDQV